MIKDRYISVDVFRLNESGSFYHSPLIDKLGNWDLSSPDIDLNSIGIHHEDKQLYFFYIH